MTPETRKTLMSSAFGGWRTPEEVLVEARLLVRRDVLALDVCATEGHQIRGCVDYITPEQDAFKVDWMARLTAARKIRSDGHAWMNPPYGRGVTGKWVALAAQWARRGVSTVALLPARTDTAWWHDFIEPIRLGSRPGTILFWRGRIRFINEQGKRGDAAPFPSVLVHIGAAQ